MKRTYVKADHNHLKAMLWIAQNNTAYYGYLHEEASLASMQEVLSARPYGIGIEDKHFYCVYDDQEIVGMIDLITHYPDAEMLWIGWLIVDQQKHHQGWGTRIYQDIEAQARTLGYQAIRLAVIEENHQGMRFWQKMGFRVIGLSKGDYMLDVMEKKLNE